MSCMREVLREMVSWLFWLTVWRASCVFVLLCV